jgi:L-2,4-diaminobutyric acid acetyltransferase
LSLNNLVEATHLSASIFLRNPTVVDAAKIWRLVRDSGVLDENSCYAYLLLFHHFSETCVIAEREEAIVGFVAAYRPPTRTDAVFVWQIGVASKARREGLGKRMLRHLVGLPACRDVKYLEATVTPSNLASRRLFESFARESNAAVTWSEAFRAKHFGSNSHEDEELVRIGPLSQTQAGSVPQ